MKSCLWLLPLLALSACMTTPDANSRVHAASLDTSVPTTPATLARYHWQLHDAVDGDNRRLDGLFGQPDKPLQLDFTDARVSARNACNAIGGEYHIIDGHLVVAPLMQTMMACADPTLMQREKTIKAMLQDKPTLIVSSQGDTPLLTLAASSGQTLTFAGQPVAAARYGGPGTIMFLEVAAQTTPCRHTLIPHKPCLLVRERHYDSHGLKSGQPGPWHPLLQDIEGYEHQPGTRNVLRVKRYTITHPAADAPSTAYELDMVVESERVTSPDAKPSPRHP